MKTFSPPAYTIGLVFNKAPKLPTLTCAEARMIRTRHVSLQRQALSVHCVLHLSAPHPHDGPLLLKGDTMNLPFLGKSQVCPVSHADEPGL